MSSLSEAQTWLKWFRLKAPLNATQGYELDRLINQIDYKLSEMKPKLETLTLGQLRDEEYRLGALSYDLNTEIEEVRACKLMRLEELTRGQLLEALVPGSNDMIPRGETADELHRRVAHETDGYM